MIPHVGQLRHKVTVQNPGASVPDGDGGYTEGWNDAVTAKLDCSITPASTNDLERYAAGTTLTAATHLVRCRWHPQLTTASRLLFKGRIFEVMFVGNPEERDRELVLVCAEILKPPTPAAASAATPSPGTSPQAAPAWVAQQPTWNTD